MKTTAAEHALKLMVDFNAELKKCNSTEQYIAFVVGVLTFSKLVEENFAELYKIDAPNDVEDALQELRLVAESLANSAIESANSKKKLDINVN